MSNVVFAIFAYVFFHSKVIIAPIFIVVITKSIMDYIFCHCEPIGVAILPIK